MNTMQNSVATNNLTCESGERAISAQHANLRAGTNGFQMILQTASSVMFSRLTIYAVIISLLSLAAGMFLTLRAPSLIRERAAENCLVQLYGR